MNRHRFQYDLDEILRNLLYARILSPSLKRSSFEYLKSFLEQPESDLHQIYRALDVLYQELDAIQAALYENSQRIQRRNTSILYYDCTGGSKVNPIAFVGEKHNTENHINNHYILCPHFVRVLGIMLPDHSIEIGTQGISHISDNTNITISRQM